MNVIRKDDLRELAAEHHHPAISIYMPTHKTLPDTQQDPIRLKNLLNHTKNMLEQSGMNSRDIHSLLAPVDTLFANATFWEHLSNGLALFIARDVLKIFRLPIRFDEQMTVSESFHIRPLLPMLHGDGHFYILALDQEQVRLFLANREDINPIDLQSVPDNLLGALRLDDDEAHIQFHTQTTNPGGGGERPAIFYGTGGGDNNPKVNILRFFQILNDGIQPLFPDKNYPLVLAGVEYLLPIYREANTYPNLVKDGVIGSQKLSSPERLHKQAWQIVSPLFSSRLDQDMDRYMSLRENKKELTTNDLSEIVSGAYFERVEVLFIRQDGYHWGHFDPDNMKTTIHENFQQGDIELLDFAAINTLLNGGTVYTLEPERLEAQSVAAAILRF